MNLFRMSFALVLTLLLAVAAQAEKPKILDKAEREPTNDKEFLIRAIACEVAEVKFADLAKKRGNSADVRKLAETLSSDHQTALDNLMEQAKKMKLAVLEGLEKDKQQEYNRIAKLEGKEFDREYLKWVVNAHEKSNTMYKKWSKDATDADLRKTVGQMQTKVSDHLSKAKKLSDRSRD